MSKPNRRQSLGLAKAGQGAAVVFFFLSLVAVAVFHSNSLKRLTSWRPINPIHSDPSWLDTIRAEIPGLTPTIRYTRRCVSRKESPDIGRKSITTVDQPLLVGTHILDIDSTSEPLQPPCVPLELELRSPPSPVDASSFMFGISTTIPRLFDSIPQIARWLHNSKASLVVLVVGASTGILEAAKAQMDAHGIEAIIVPADENHDEHKRHLAILGEIYKWQHPNRTKWHIAVDDDTFFPYMPALVDHMRKYNPDELYYIGALSENQHSVDMYGEQAYGGGGVFLSAALAEEIHESFEACMRHEPAAGDVMIRDCVYRHTDGKITVDDDFHQLDMMGDISGFYESGGMPLSLHHWKSRNFNILPIVHMHLISDYCSDCFLQRWRFTDNFVLSNGFSAVQYPRGIDFNLERMERTFYQEDSPPLWRITDLRAMIPPQDKLSYRLHTAFKQDDGSIRQIYLMRGGNDDNTAANIDDQIIELHWSDRSTS